MFRFNFCGLQIITTHFNFHVRNYVTKATTRPVQTIAQSSSQTDENKIAFDKLPERLHDEFPAEEPVNYAFLVRTIGSNYNKWVQILEKNPELKSLTRHEISNSVKALKALEYDADDIVERPKILNASGTTILNRHSVLNECGFKEITLGILFKYVTVMRKSVAILKSFRYIPYDLNVAEQLCTRFTDVRVELETADKLEANNEENDLRRIRQLILNCYLKQRLEMTDADIDKMWRSYPRVRHRSFAAVQAIIELLINEMRFSKERIIKNSFLLHGDAQNVRRILAYIPAINGQDIRDIGYRRPKILMSSCDGLVKTLHHVKEFGISEAAVSRCLEVLTLGPDTVIERLRDLNQVEEFQALKTNPRVLRLVHYQNKARLRLEYLNQLKVRCASLHILSCGSDAFVRFARDGSDRTKGRDVVVYLANVLDKNEHHIRSLMSRQSNWCHIPVLHVKQCYEFLLSRYFTPDDIYDNLHLVLYPIKRIQEKLAQLQTTDYLEKVDPANHKPYELSNSEILTLTLYLIECDFHFTGDGIWSDQHTQTVENFSNLLPDFPQSFNKVYKYGTKPAGSRKAAAEAVLNEN